MRCVFFNPPSKLIDRPLSILIIPILFGLCCGPVSKPDYSGAKIVVAMVSLGVPYHCLLCIDTDSPLGTIPFLMFQVGLPARGKSYLSNKLMRYLQVRDLAVEGCLATLLTDIIFPVPLTLLVG